MKAALIASLAVAAAAGPFNTCATDQLGVNSISVTPEPLVAGKPVSVNVVGKFCESGDFLIEGASLPEPRRGVLDHMAFRAEGLPATLAALKAMGVGYRLRRIPAPMDDWQLFFDDPNGATVEFDFAGSEQGETDEP